MDVFLHKVKHYKVKEMTPLRSSNPAFTSKAFEQGISSFAGTDAETMTVNGTVNKTLMMGFLLAASASYVWTNPSTTLMWVGIIGGLIAAMVTVFKPDLAHITAPLYALLKGMALGMISLVFENAYGGEGGLGGSIVFQAVTSTLGVLFAMLFLYRSGLIKVTQKFRTGLLAATGGIFFMYLINMILSMFGASFLSLENTSLLMIGLNIAIVAVAALNLILDFDFIDKGVQSGAPKKMEWFGAFGLIVTLVWLYLEILKLLARLSGRD